MAEAVQEPLFNKKARKNPRFMQGVESVKLTVWCTENKETITKLTLPEVTKMASAAIGAKTPLAEHSVRMTMKHLGLTPVRKAVVAPKAHKATKVELLAELKALRAEVVEIKSHQVEIHHEMLELKDAVLAQWAKE